MEVKKLLKDIFAPTTCKVGKVEIEIPKGHMLPVRMAKYRNYNWNLTNLAGLINIKYPNTPIIDVGANIGDTVAFIRNMGDNPVLSIEGDSSYMPILHRNLDKLGNALIVPYMLSDKVETRHGAIKADNKGSSAIVEGEVAIPYVTLDEVLMENPDFFGAKLFKTDTDGFDDKVIFGAEKYITETKPIIFTEYIPLANFSIFRYLHDHGYAFAQFYDNFGNKMVTVSLSDVKALSSLVWYIREKSSPVKYYDIAFFHEYDKNLVS